MPYHAIPADLVWFGLDLCYLDHSAVLTLLLSGGGLVGPDYIIF